MKFGIGRSILEPMLFIICLMYQSVLLYPKRGKGANGFWRERKNINYNADLSGMFFLMHEEVPQQIRRQTIPIITFFPFQ